MNGKMEIVSDTDLLAERVKRHMRLLKSGDIMRLTQEEALDLWHTGKYPADFFDRPESAAIVAAKPQKPKPPPTARQNERAARLQRRGNAARAGYIEGAKNG